MTGFIADDVAYIARRLREIKGEKEPLPVKSVEAPKAVDEPEPDWDYGAW